MSWALGFDHNWHRDIGYGVPSECDHPTCKKRIDRGMAYLCGGHHMSQDRGCGLFFCCEHLDVENLCERCRGRRPKPPFSAKLDVRQWLRHKLRDTSWKAWRTENPEDVSAIRKQLSSPE